LFSDQHFHNTGVPPRDAAKPDRGRAAAIARVRADEFNCLGPFSDAKPTQCQELRFMATDDASMEGAFKTPGLRGVSLRPPYMHAGQFASIEEVIAHYTRAPAAMVGQTELAHGGSGHSERKPIRLSEHEVKALASFLGTLSGPITEVAKNGK
jgi:cytochrome c peroxidase